MKTLNSKTSRPRGRPLSFDRDIVLERAMHVFWRKGYELATVHDLTEAMGITAPSLYAAFGDKEQLYLEAMQLYRDGPGELASDILDNGSTAYEAIRDLLNGACRAMADPNTPNGCMLVNSAVSSGIASPKVQQAVTDCRQAAQVDLTTRIQRGIDEGDVPPHVDASTLARFYVTVLTGIAIHSREGLSCADFQAVIDSAMRAWPAPAPAAVSSTAA